MPQPVEIALWIAVVIVAVGAAVWLVRKMLG